MPTAVLEKPSLMELSLSELISEAIALGGEKVHDMAKAMGHVRHKKTWVAVINQVAESIEPIIIGTETDMPFSDDEDDEDEEIEIGDRTDEEIELNSEIIFEKTTTNRDSDYSQPTTELTRGRVDAIYPEVNDYVVVDEYGDRLIVSRSHIVKVLSPDEIEIEHLKFIVLAEILMGEVEEFGSLEDVNTWRKAKAAIDCPPPPPPVPIVRPCPERMDIPTIEIAKEEKCGDVGSDRRECTNTYEKPCTTCEGSGLLDKNLTCINCNGKGWRSREEQLTINIRNICRQFVCDLHDSVFPWNGNMQCTQWKEIMSEVAAVKWQTVAGLDIWQICQRMRELYKYCDDRKPNWGRLSPSVPDLIEKINENHWLLLLIYPDSRKFTEDDHPYFASDIDLADSYCPPKYYDKWGVLGNTHLFIIPNEVQAENIFDINAGECLVLRGAE